MTTPGDKPTRAGTHNNSEEIMILEVRGDMGRVDGGRGGTGVIYIRSYKQNFKKLTVKNG